MKHSCPNWTRRYFKPMVTEMLNKNKDLFSAKGSELTFTDTVKCHIDTRDALPIRLRPYRNL